MRRIISVAMSLILAVTMIAFVPREPAEAATSTSALRVAVVRSAIAYGTRSYIGGAYLNGGDGSNAQYDSRVDAVRQTLVDSKRFAAVDEIGDSQLSSLSALESYDVVVFPRTLGLSAAERSTILAFVARGGGVVGSFGLSRWDYSSAYQYGYKPFLGMSSAPGLYTWPPSSDALKVWEWGDVSELFNVKFKNDDLMGAGYKVVGKSVTSHPILQGAASDLGVSSLSMTAKVADYNEVVYTVPGATNVKPLLTYSTTGNASTLDNGDNGLLAGWTSEYNFGRFVYFGFQLHDLCRGLSYYGDTATVNTARALLVNSVAWAGNSATMGASMKTTYLSAKAWTSKGTLYVNQAVKNTGSVPLRGPLTIELYNPAGSRVFSGQAYSNSCPLAPGAEYVHSSWQVSVGSSPARGTWTVKMGYRYWDYFRQGTATATRSLSLYSNGTSLTQGVYSAQKIVGGSIAPAAGFEQLAGDTRYDTGIELSQAGWSSGVSASGAIILATGANYPDALAAAPLAGTLDAPVLLVPRSGLTTALRAEIARLYRGRTTAKIIAVGGEDVVLPSVVEAAEEIIEAQGATVDFERLAGSDRWATAAAIAAKVGVRTEGTFKDTVFVVSGQNYPDALAASPIAARNGVPILLSKQSELPAQTAAALDDLGVKHVIMVGGVGVVGVAVESAIEAAGHRVPGVGDNDNTSVDTRLQGSSRYDTSMRCSAYALALGGFDDSDLFFATGRNWPDALGLASVAGQQRHPLVLLDGTELQNSSAVADYLRSRTADTPGVTFVGGSGAIEDYVIGQVRIALGL